MWTSWYFYCIFFLILSSCVPTNLFSWCEPPGIFTVFSFLSYLHGTMLTSLWHNVDLSFCWLFPVWFDFRLMTQCWRKSGTSVSLLWLVMLANHLLKKPKIDPPGVFPKFVFTTNLFCDLKPHAKFQTHTITPSGRKVTWHKERKIKKR